MDTRIRDTLVLAALNQATEQEHPEEGLLIHTDRGAQYTSQRFQALLMRYGFQQSMRRKGNTGLRLQYRIFREPRSTSSAITSDGTATVTRKD